MEVADEESTLQLLKDHQSMEESVETYAEKVGSLSQQCQHLLEIAHPESEKIMKQQSHIDRLYLSVKDMVEHRKTKLEQQYWLYQLNKDVEELEKWITEREVVASSTELGHDLEDVSVLQERFTKFVTETNSIGQQRLEQVNKLVNEMIKCDHSDAATIAEWKDGLNDSWADLLELMKTRTQMLAASRQLHKFFTDCKEVLAQVAEKMKQLPELRSCQANITNAATLQRVMLSFEHGLQLLVAQVRQLQENSTQLRTIYAGEKAEAILGQEQEVIEAWRELLSACEASHVQVTSVTDKVQFFSVVRENLMWMEGIMGQIGWDEPRDLTALEMMMKQHQELKGKIDGRSKTIQQCADLGKILIAAGDSASEEIKEKLESLQAKQRDLLEKWGKHEEKLQKKKERFHFSQETVKAEVWLKAKEPLITSDEQEREAQSQKDEVEQLILRHKAFRKAAVTWKERFSSLRKLSTTENKQGGETTPSFSSQRMLPLSCLTPSVPSSSSSSLFLRHVAQAQIEAKTNLDLSTTSVTQRLCSSPASYNSPINDSGYAGLGQHCSGKLVTSTYVGMNHEAAGGDSDTAFSVITSHRDGVNTSSYLTINPPTSGSVDSSGDFGLTAGSVGRMQHHPGDGRLESPVNLAQQSSGTGGIPTYLHQPKMGNSGYLGQPQHIRCSGYVDQQSILGDTVNLTQHQNMVDSGYLGQIYPSSGGTSATDYLPRSHFGSGLISSGYLTQSGGILEPKMAYTWQNLKSDFTQPKINNLHKAVNPLLHVSTMQREHYGEIPLANMIGPETGLELLHGRLQRDPRGSRSDPQMDHLRQEREYKLGRQTSSEQEIQARLNELPMIVRQERYRRHLERQSSSEKEGSSKQRLQRQDSSDLEASIKTGSDKHTSDKRTTMAEIVEQVQEREAAHSRGEMYRPSSSLSAPVTRFDGRPRARDRPKPRRRPRPKEPEEARRSRSAPATGAPTTPQPPSHTAQNEGFLYRKKVTTSDLEGQQRSPNSKSWVNVYCVLKEGKLTFYKDARNHNTTYNEEPPLDLSNCSFDPSMGYKKKKNVFILRMDDGNNFAFHAKDEEDLKAWTSNITICIAEYKAMKKWDKPDMTPLDPDHSERKEKSEGDVDARSERSEQALGDERSDKGDRSEKLDTSEIADRMEGGAGESSASLKSK
ncbi:LOW QUALITY PROTEIN: spectrin beta chain, non-erythrocytic 4-like [Takifugu rubripes]|nr:LOW QUALITY PROTEIN: spectrin beta chain, non-erythrocytic 4-like [Takifugu rubripes]